MFGRESPAGELITKGRVSEQSGGERNEAYMRTGFVRGGEPGMDNWSDLSFSETPHAVNVSDSSEERR